MRGAAENRVEHNLYPTQEKNMENAQWDRNRQEVHKWGHQDKTRGYYPDKRERPVGTPGWARQNGKSFKSAAMYISTTAGK